jgi:TonB family protein
MAGKDDKPEASPAETIFSAALELPPDKRQDYLASACGEDMELRKLVDALLRAHEAPAGFLPEEHAAMSTGARAALNIQPVTTEQVGDYIGRYKLLQKIGEGGCGVVYMAEQEEPVRRKVAIKVMKLGMDSEQGLARFEVERDALTLMHHPNVAKVVEADAMHYRRPYFVMELVAGSKITEYCNRNELTTRQRLELFKQVCRGIQHAHQKGIIHRDIKPSNILVETQDGVHVPKVIDFGIAKAAQGRLTGQNAFSAFEQFLGTPAYMSPEQAQPGGLDVDTRSDIYSLGVLLYELLTGKTPFEAKELLTSGLDVMRRTIREKEPLTPSTRLRQDSAIQQAQDSRQSKFKIQYSEIADDLDWIVMKCLKKDRAQRYDTVHELESDIDRHLNNEPVVARPPSLYYHLQKFVRRNRVTASVAAIVLVGLVLTVIVNTSQVVRATRVEKEQSRLRQLAEEFRENDRQQIKEAIEREGHERELAAYSFLANALIGAGVSNQFSPDGTKLITMTPSGVVTLWDVHTGKPIGEPLQYADGIIAASFNQDGTQITTISKGGIKRVCDASTGNQLSGGPAPSYPPPSMQRGEQGTVILSVISDAEGNSASVKIMQSSGYQLLDSAAVETVRSKWLFPRGAQRTNTVPIIFDLGR